MSCILVCGDDKGTLWVYDLVKYVTGTISSPITGGSPVAPVEPVALLDWPELEDAEVSLMFVKERERDRLTDAEVWLCMCRESLAISC